MPESTTTLPTPDLVAVDGTLVLGSLLGKGFEVSVYPRQVVTAIDPASDGPELAFVHGLPSSSGLAPVTYAQDKRMRRALLERHRVPIPRGATFTMSRGIRGAHRFAAQVGFPVVIKPAVGDSIIETHSGLGDVAAMDRALDELRTPPSERPGFSRAAYGLTELREPGEENGRIVVPPGYTFLVEKQLSGHYLRFLVIDGEIASVIDCDGAPGDGTLRGGVEITNQVHPGLVEIALRGARAIPGLAVVAVDLVTADPRADAASPGTAVVELSERPGLWVQRLVDPGLADRLATRIVEAHLASHGIGPGSAAEHLEVVLEAHAIPDVEQGADVITSAATAYGLVARVRDTDRLAGVVRADLHGAAGSIAQLTDDLLDGRIDQLRVMLAVLSPTAG
ncbi:MAG TPA: hypothetical protein IAA98_13875 [Candidatus Avipropionibacterium avicola]|uniref:ATP-grasp domain-containing protein n=1 Tax=Candidatus Avipropionibacterium avicola TaxID=2840701 RepID=A0A9D1KNM0_9ACTN|nr:hypothetical protein [Candidatus Avipropionibacterium avicola]